MKHFITLVIVIGIVALFLFLLARKNEVKTVTKKWNNLIHSENKNQELKAVEDLSAWIFKKYGSIGIDAINNKGEKINAIQHRVEDIKDF